MMHLLQFIHFAVRLRIGDPLFVILKRITGYRSTN